MFKLVEKQVLHLLEALKKDVENEIIDIELKEDISSIFEAYIETVKRGVYVQRSGRINWSKKRKSENNK